MEKMHRPPRLPDRFLQWFCTEEVLETLQGDLYELYEKRRERRGKWLADAMYCADVASACRPFAFKREKSERSHSISYTMLTNYLKVAFRQLSVRKFYSGTNVLGLVIGLTSSIYILLYVQHELSYDDFHAKGDRIFRIISRFTDGGIETDYGTTQIPLAAELKENRSEVELAVRFIEIEKVLIENESRSVSQYEEHFYYADPSVFDLFSFRFIEGDPGTALVSPNTAVITHSTAQKYFPKEDPMGQTLRNGNNGDVYQITGVIEDFPGNSHLKFSALLSYSTFPSDQFASWDGWYPITYLLLKAADKQSIVESALADISNELVAPIFESYGLTVSYWLQPMRDIHLKSNFGDSQGESSDISYIYILSIVGFLSVVLASINYMNLATALASKRAKEVGVRKTMGSFKRQLITQFLVESSLTSLIAFVISVALVVMLLPAFNQFSDKEITLNVLLEPQIIAGSIAAMLFVGFVGGCYPAFYLSRFSPAKVLKGNVSHGKANGVLRRVLVVTQFSISTVMLICTMVIYDQLVHMRSTDLGFRPDQVLSVAMPDSSIQFNYATLYNRLKAQTGVSEVSSSSTKPGGNMFYSLLNIDSPEGMINRGIDFYWADYDFVTTMGLQIKEGRNFSRKFRTDSMAALVNESMVARMQWDNPIGKRFGFDDGNEATVDPVYSVVGVINDYHQQSLHSPIAPLAVFFREKSEYLNIKVSAQNVAGTLATIEETWTDINPGKPFSFRFLDEDFQSQYYADEKRAHLFTLFSILAMIVACLGLLGLVAFTLELRIKEIGIRKVLGASILQLWKMLSKDFVTLIIISCFIAMPVAYYFMSKWLENFAYRVDISWYILAIAGMGSVILTLFTVSFHAIKAATANPVNSLKTE